MPDQEEIQQEADDDPIDSEWVNLRGKYGEPPRPAFLEPPGLPDANLRPEVQDVLGLLRNSSAVGRLQRRLIELAQAFSVRPEDVPDGLLLEREKATLKWISMSPYYPMSSPGEAIELLKTATWLATKPTAAERASRADALWRVLEPSLR